MDKLLTADEVASRWQLTTAAVWDAVDDTANPLSFLYLGRGKAKRGQPGQRGSYRFRLQDVEAWELRARRSFAQEGQAADESAAQALTGQVGHDGKLRGGQKGRRKMSTPT